MKLELKHLAPYLPYRLKGIDYDKKNFLFRGLNDYGNIHWDCNEVLDRKGYDIKPVLRPMKDVFKDEYKFILDEFSEIELETFEIAFFSELRPLNIFDKISYSVAILLYENHFDIHGLIEKCLAVDINSI